MMSFFRDKLIPNLAKKIQEENPDFDILLCYQLAGMAIGKNFLKTMCGIEPSADSDLEREILERVREILARDAV